MSLEPLRGLGRPKAARVEALNRQTYVVYQLRGEPDRVEACRALSQTRGLIDYHQPGAAMLG